MNSTLSNGMRWYAVQCLSNHEDKVRRYLAKYKEEDEVFAKDLNEVLVPIETVSEVKNGKKRQRDRKFYPGYVFVEMKLYDKVYEHLTLDSPTPDLVIYLQAPVEVLMGRIDKRGNEYEQYLTNEYLTKINEAYSRFFLDYEKAPVLIVNAADINFEENEEDYEMLVTKIMSNPKGKTFINPQPSIL